jgi:L-ascorbate metabolism protein UlaG (beta-lactamase superfamily)
MSLTQRIAAAAVPPDAVAIFWIGQGGFVFKTAEGAIIYADPYLSNSCQSPRLVEIPIAPEEVRADLVLMTHDHLDHTDPETLPHIARSSSAVFAGPESSCLHLQELGVPADRTVAMAPGDQRRLAGTLVGAVFARHTEDSVGFVLDFGGPTVYLTGDTE